MIQLELTPKQDEYALYNLHSPDGTLLHIGIVPMRQLTSLSDVPHELLTGRLAYLTLIKTDRDRTKLANQALQTDKPDLRERLISTINSWNKRSNGNAVECIETGEQWPSAAACARAQQVTYTQLTKHIAGERSYNSVKGNTYRKVGQ